MSWDNFEDAVVKQSVAPGTKCGVGKLLDSLPDEAAKSIRRVFENPSFATSSIYRAIKERAPEEKIAEGTVARHRKGECRCGRTA